MTLEQAESLQRSIKRQTLNPLLNAHLFEMLAPDSEDELCVQTGDYAVRVIFPGVFTVSLLTYDAPNELQAFLGGLQ